MKLHPVIPVISDWCRVCQAYQQHANGCETVGSVASFGRPVPMTTIRCNVCSWVTRIK